MNANVSQWITDHIMPGVDCQLSEFDSGDQFAEDVLTTWPDALCTYEDLVDYWREHTETTCKEK